MKLEPIQGFPNYYITDDGRVFRQIKAHVDRKGYPYFNLHTGDGGYKGRSIHRLIALTFIPNPDNKPEVNHINADKSDFSIENLEWVTRQENMQHAFKLGLLQPPGTRH
jgi:hypothetical protein